ncbi:PIN domain-containing protein [Athalassotoga saccharophila]|uniref:PIN domain-containing protein n=1 Tax=Athalassotoga saccharophila TaxID=1441386 RepID=UPI001379D972|nr:PIN domain-containing protein [Athalassotoga saccharophila]BBJ27815.1 tRNA(fMet)-specific endonuclease VapC [Athalassotoga saccharophila]
MRFIDTNVFLRYFTADDPEKSKNSLELLKKIENGEEMVTTSSLVIFETIFTLEHSYKVPRSDILQLLEPILNLKGLSLENKSTFIKALKIYSGGTFSFADAFNVAVMKKMNIKEIYSYDRDFDKIDEIKRIEP